MTYLEWNNLIAKHFFNQEKAGKEVLLYVNEALIEELGKSQNCGVADFINAVKIGPGWTTRSTFCQMALQTCFKWRNKGLEYPPYIAYLAFFVLAAGTHMDVRADAYYPRLRKLLGEDNTKAFPSFNRMHILWEDLEKWTKEEKNETWGRFVFGIEGKMLWVGLPRFQTVLSEDERNGLAVFFEAVDLDPSDPPSPEIMLKLMLFHGDNFFQKRTMGLLRVKTGDDIVLKNRLVEFVLEELEEWDGIVLQPADENTAKVSYRVQSGLRLCMEIDSVAKKSEMYVRLKTKRPFPDEELNFISSGMDINLICKEASQGWSKIIRRDSLDKFNASLLDWTVDFNVVDKEHNWRARLKSSTTRLYISAENEGFAGWVETQRLERDRKFKITAYGKDVDKVKIWGEKNCDNFRIMAISGLPNGWVLFEGENAKISCEGIDILTVSSSVRLSFRGGIKIRAGNTYLQILPPVISLENASGKEIVTVNNRPLIKAANEVHTWLLPEGLQINEVLKVETDVAGQKLGKVLRLEEVKIAEDYKPPYRDVYGNIYHGEKNGQTLFSGAVTQAQTETSVPDVLFIKPAIYRSIFFIGKNPGQIVEWPLEALPDNWKPIWAIEQINRKEWMVIYCRKSLDDSQCAAETVCQDHQRIKKWKEIVWVKRKTV